MKVRGLKYGVMLHQMSDCNVLKGMDGVFHDPWKGRIRSNNWVTF